jgi:UDP-N-acetylmuramoyl-tripeptide--D-alanyl-D-alanine ligase
MAELGAAGRPAHLEVGGYVAENRMDQLFVVGEGGRWIAEGARRSGLTSVVEAADAEDVARRLREFARPGDVILIKASRAARLERVAAAFGKEPCFST